MTGPDDNLRPEFGLLVDLAEGRLDPATARELESEAERAMQSGDPETTATLAWLRGFLDAARTLPLQSAPPIVTQKLRGHFARWSRARATLDEPPTELPASLLFDSRMDLTPVGVRGADGLGETVHLAYTTEQADLVLDVHRLGGSQIRLDGQVLLTATGQAPVFEATVSGPSGSRRTVDGDILGNFSLNDVPEDVTEVRVTNGDLLIVATLDLRAEDADR